MCGTICWRNGIRKRVGGGDESLTTTDYWFRVCGRPTDVTKHSAHSHMHACTALSYLGYITATDFATTCISFTPEYRAFTSIAGRAYRCTRAVNSRGIDRSITIQSFPRLQSDYKDYGLVLITSFSTALTVPLAGCTLFRKQIAVAR